MPASYDHIPIIECGEPMVNLADQNFILEPVLFRLRHSPNPQMWLRQSLVTRLREAQEKFLRPDHKIFKILDAWRPRSVQAAVYGACMRAIAGINPDWNEDEIRARASQFVRDPAEDSIPSHATGGAVDIIVSDPDDGDADMGEIHYLDWRAGHPPLAPARAKKVAENQRLLKLAMQSAGFAQDPDLWWHFDYGNQKWAADVGADVAIYDELDETMNFRKKDWGYGHGILLPFEIK